MATQSTARNAALQALWEAGGEMTAVDLYRAILTAHDDTRDAEQMCRDAGYEPDDPIIMTANGMESAKQTFI